MKTREERIEAYVRANRKSLLGAFVLSTLFGPIGHLYASPVGALFAILIALGLAMVHPALVLIVWAVCALTAPLAAAEHNKRIRTKAELMAA